MLIDTHAHVDAPQFDEDREEVLARAREAGVVQIINIGYNRETIASTLELTRRHPFLFAAVGWHPTDAHTFDQEAAQWLIQLCEQEQKVVAIGEIGLDYHWDNVPPEVQERVFREQIGLAVQLGKPIIIHNRKADADTVRILKEEGAHRVGGIMHCFAGDWDMAQECLAMNFAIGLGGIVTFKNAQQVKEVARRLPLDRLVLETDSPYLAPVPYRGKRNEPAYVRRVAEEIAALRGISVDEVIDHSARNAWRLFPAMAMQK